MSETVMSQDYTEFFEKVIPIRFSCLTPSGWPTLVSLWYLYSDEKIFCSTQKDAKIVKYLKGNSKCAFEVAADKPPYKGIRGQGNVTLRTDISDEILNSLMKRYLGDEKTKLKNFLKKKSHNEITIEITPKKLFTWDYSRRMTD